MLSFISLSSWKGVFAGLGAFPALVATAILGILGQRSRAQSLTQWIRRAWLGLPPDDSALAPGWRRWAVLLISAVAFIVTLYLLAGIGMNFGYPLRPDAKPTDWGGPSLAGRWAVHAAGGVLFVVLTPLISGALAALARRVQR